AHTGQFSNGAIGDVTYAAERAQNGCMHISDERTSSGVVVHIFQNQDSRRGTLENTGPKIASVVVMAATNGRIFGPQSRGNGISHHRSGVGEHASALAIGKSGVAP